MTNNPSPILIQYHNSFLIWFLYLSGWALHVSLQVDDIARKNKWTRAGVVKAIGDKVAFRGFVGAMIFGLIWHYPLLISGAVKIFGAAVTTDEVSVLAIPMNYFIAGLYGSGFDSLLGYVPGLKSWLPDVAA